MSTRDISNDNVTALNARVVRPILFGRFSFDGGTQTWHTEIGPRDATHPVFGSETYQGIGDFGGIIADLTESVGQAPQAVKLAVSGVKSALLNTGLTDDYYRRDAELMFGFDDENGDLIDDPVIVWSGFMDKVDIHLGDQVGEMTLTCESRATNLQGASDLRFTDEDLQAEYSGDLGGEYIFRMVDLVIQWGGEQLRDSGSGPRRGFGSPGASSTSNTR